MKKIIQLFCFFIFTSLLFSCSETPDPILPLRPYDSNYFYFYDNQGNLKFDVSYNYAGAYRDGLAIVKLIGNNQEYVFIDEKGKIAINGAYKNISVFSEGLAWVVPRNKHVTAIDKNGKEKFSIKEAEEVRIFKNGLSAYSVKDSTGIKWGFVDIEGKTVIKPQFVATGNFNNGICAVMDDFHQWGFIDKKGQIIIDYKFDFASNISKNKKIVVSLNDKFGVIDEKGEYLFEPKFDSIVVDKETFLVKQNQKWGWIDIEGKPIIDAQFEDAKPFRDNELTAVKQKGLYGYIDKKGIVKIDYKYKKAYPFMGSIAYVEENDPTKGSLINSDGKFVKNSRFYSISDDLIAYLNGGNSTYETVKTDYFDMESILKNINLNSLDCVNLNDKINAITPKLFNKKVSTNMEQDLTIDCLKKVSADGFLSSYLIRNKNDNNKIAGFWYKIEIASNRNFYKPHDLEIALIKKLKGYTKIDAPNAFINQDVIKAFKNDKHILLITGYSGVNEFTVQVLSLDTEVEDFKSRSYSNYQITDTDDSPYLYERKQLLSNYEE